jgi:beta-1,4-mannosyltransferase
MASHASVSSGDALAARVRRGPAATIATWPSVLATNPYQRLLYDQLADHGFRLAENPVFKLRWIVPARRRVQILHFHWPQPFWSHGDGPGPLRLPLSWVKLALFGARLAVARLLRYRVVWTVHQVLPHEVGHERVDKAGARTLALFANVLLVHDRGTAAAARAALGASARKVAIVPHGSYIGVYPPGRPRDVVREELGIPRDAFVFLCFGDLRAYKEVGRLLEAFEALRQDEVRLIVAGSISDDAQGAAVRAAAARDSRVVALLGFVPTERVAELYGAADAAVVGRSDGGTSGSLILALSMEMPLVAATTPTYDEVAGPGCGWQFDPGDVATLTRALEAAAASDEVDRTAKRVEARARAEALSWRDIARRTAALMGGGEDPRS